MWVKTKRRPLKTTAHRGLNLCCGTLLPALYSASLNNQLKKVAIFLGACSIGTDPLGRPMGGSNGIPGVGAHGIPGRPWGPIAHGAVCGPSLSMYPETTSVGHMRGADGHARCRSYFGHWRSVSCISCQTKVICFKATPQQP